MTARECNKNRIDIRGGKLLYKHRIELGEIFQSEADADIKFKAVFKALHSFEPKLTEIESLTDYFNEIVNGIRHWIELETELLQHKPTPEEVMAGIRGLSKKVGVFGTVKAIAKTFGKDPDEVLNWEYGKVFGILYTDLEEYKFQKEYHKIMSKK